MNPLSRIISILENHKLHRMRDLYKALYKIYMISIKYIKIILCKIRYEGKTQELSETFSFDRIRS